MSDDEDEMRAMRGSRKYQSSEAGNRSHVSAALSLQGKAEKVAPTLSSDEKISTQQDTTVKPPTDGAFSEDDMMRQMMGFGGFGAMKESSLLNVYQQKLDDAKRKDDVGTVKTVANQSSDLESDDDDIIGPLPVRDSGKPKDGDDDDDEDDDTDDEPSTVIPISHEVSLSHGSKVVSALALDPSGARLASGGFDYELKFWDFNSMDANMKSFRQIQPMESHWIHSLHFSTTGDQLLVAAGNAQPKVLDRDGHEVYVCKKGDQYLVDMKISKGHVSAVRHACWHPKDREEFMTCGEDGTIRLWDITKVKKCKTVIKTKNKQARKTPATFCSYTRDSKLVFAGCGDGSIQAWDTRKMFVNTAYQQRLAHAEGADITCIAFALDGHTLASRSMDDTLKTWDLRAFQKPLNVAVGLSTFYATTSCLFSPDDRLIVTGTSVKKGEGAGQLLFLDRMTLRPVDRISFPDTSVVSCAWHTKLNQIVAGLSSGDVKVLFDPERSSKGAKLCVGKVKRPRCDPGEGLGQAQIVNPHSLRMFREKRTDTIKKMKAKQRADPIASHKPQTPLDGRGTGGRLKQGTSLAGFVIKNIAVDLLDERNPREALLSQDAAAKADPFWIAPAYAETQPKAYADAEFYESSDEEDDEKVDQLLASKRPKFDNKL